MFSENIVLATRLSQNAEVMRRTLATQGLNCTEATSIREAIAAIRAGAAMVIFTEDVLAVEDNLTALIDCLNKQPEWSDIPVIFVLKNCRRFPACIGMMQDAHHQRSITLLEAPLSRQTFLAVVRICLNNRQRQYQLQATLQRLNESNQALESFSHTVAHELRNPLSVVTGSLNFLTRGTLEEREQKMAQMGLRTCRKMAHTLNTLLEYGKLKERRDLAFERVDMMRVVECAVETLQAVIEDRQAAVDWIDLPTVWGNVDLLENLVTNLIKNAIVHNTDPVPAVMITSKCTANRHHFQVIDNGPGIALSDQQQIFGMFARAGQRKVEGSGIGLALCQRIVEQHGGKLGVESEIGRGCRFFFDLPTVEGTGDRAPQDANS